MVQARRIGSGALSFGARRGVAGADDEAVSDAYSQALRLNTAPNAPSPQRHKWDKLPEIFVRV